MTRLVIHVKCFLPRRHVPFARSWKERNSRSFIQKTGTYIRGGKPPQALRGHTKSDRFLQLPRALWGHAKVGWITLTASPGFVGTCQMCPTIYGLHTLGDIAKVEWIAFTASPGLRGQAKSAPIFLRLPASFRGHAKVIWIGFYGLPRLYGDMPKCDHRCYGLPILCGDMPNLPLQRCLGNLFRPPQILWGRAPWPFLETCQGLWGHYWYRMFLTASPCFSGTCRSRMGCFTSPRCAGTCQE